MEKIILISCVSKKMPFKSKVRDLYISSLFKKNLSYAISLKPNKMFVLSAKYGLLEMTEEIEPYEQTLNNMTINEIKQWSQKVLKQLKEKTSLENDHFIFLAGEKYRKFLIPHILHYDIPLKNLGIGRQLKFLKENTKENTK